MDSSTCVDPCDKKELSAGDVGGSRVKPASSPNFYTGSENGSSLDLHEKKVGQFLCEDPQRMSFLCKHCGDTVYRTLSCHARFEVDCPKCAYEWRKRTRKNFARRIKQMKFPALVSLTLRKGGEHVLKELLGLAHICRKYVRRKKKNKNRCKKCGNYRAEYRFKKKDKTRCKTCGKRHKKHNDRCCNKCSNTYDIRACVSCLELPNHLHAVWDCDFIPYKLLSYLWEQITDDSFIVDIRKVDRQRWKKALYYLTKYITKISECGSRVGMKGVHVVNSWGAGGYYYQKMQMVCKKCGCNFMPLQYNGQVDDYENDPVDFVISIKGPPLKYLRLLAMIVDNRKK